MHSVEVTPAVWQRLLSIRSDNSCFCCGDWSADERAALALYGPLARRDLGPSVLGQIGQSLDGRISTFSDDVGEISGPDGIEHLHRIRALVDAVVIGVKTALNDRPQLTVRLCEGVNPVRVVIDPNGRLPNDSPVLNPDGTRRIIIQAAGTKRSNGVEVIQLPSSNGQIEPGLIQQSLHQAGLSNILVEGGSLTLAKFIEAGSLGRLHVAVAPVLIGNGPSGLTMANAAISLSDAIRPQTRSFAVGTEVIFDCALNLEAVEASLPPHAI